MKLPIYGICIALLFLGFFLFGKLKRFSTSTAAEPSLTQTLPQQDAPKIEPELQISKRSTKKKCPCCSNKSSVAHETAKKRQQTRESWARKTIASYGFEEGMKQIAAKDPRLAIQMHRTLKREKRLGLVTATSQSYNSP